MGNNKMISRKITIALISLNFCAAGFFQTAQADDAQAAKADGQSVSEQSCDIESIKSKFESGGSGGYSADNKLGFIGKYQMGAQALEEMGYLKPGSSSSDTATYSAANWTGKNGIYSAADWKANTAVQEAVEPLWQQKQASHMLSVTKNAVATGAQIPGGCGTMTASAYSMGAHLVVRVVLNPFLKAAAFAGDKDKRLRTDMFFNGIL